MSPHVLRVTVLALRSIGLIGYVICAFAASTVAGELPQPEMLLFDEPVITAAAKHAQTLSEAPAAVTVITREDIRRFGYRTLAEALRSVRGFYGSYDRNYSSIGVRGLLRGGGYNDAILLLVNGHTYNDDVYGEALLGTEFGIDLEAIERIEVVRGPSSALYGGNAMFAVVNVITSSGQDRPGVRALTETGSYGRKRGQVSAGHVFENGLDLFASGSVLDTDGQSALFYPEYNSPATNDGIAHDADGDRALNFFVSARYQDFFFQSGANTREKHVPTGAFGATFDDPGTKTIDGRQFAELQYSRDVWGSGLLAMRAYYDGLRYHGTYIYGTGSERRKNEDLATSHWFGTELTGQWEVSSHQALTVGAEYTYHPAIEQENFNIGGVKYLDDRRTYGTWGIYAQHDWRLMKTLSLVTGVRADRYDSRALEFTPRVAAIWRARPETTLKLLFGKAFRQPSIYEQYYTSPDLGTLGGPRLKPERVTTYEAVVEQQLWNRISAVASVYHYELFHLIDQQLDGTLLQFRNGSAVHANGAEFGLRVPLPHSIEARGSYSLQEVRAAGGTLLTNSPKHLGDIRLLFPLPRGVEAGAELQLVGPRQTLAGHQVGTEAAANLTLNYRPPVRGVEFDLGLYNLFNQHYADPGGIEHVQDQISQDGFTFRVGLQYGF